MHRPPGRLLAVLVVFGLGLFATRAVRSATSAGTLGVEMYATPAQVVAGGRLRYDIIVQNRAATALSGIIVTDELPPGFRYVPGSAIIRADGRLVAHTEPGVNGQRLEWNELQAPGGAWVNVHGIHTFVQDRCTDTAYVDYQLDRARALMGPGASVRQLFYPVTTSTSGARSCWHYFVEAAYNHELHPIIRLAGRFEGSGWQKPAADSPGHYTTIAAAVARVVADLPRRDGIPLIIEVWNEPNLDIEWSGAANAAEYGAFLRDVAAAIRGLNDSRILIANGGLAPGGNILNTTFVDGMVAVPGALEAFDLWSAHPYPSNHPPEYNLHGGTARHTLATIDSYLLELARLRAAGRSGFKVLLTETGYALGDSSYAWDGFPAITEDNRADYVSRALSDYWQAWPEVQAVTPYELVDSFGNWAVWDWIYPNGTAHRQYDVVAAQAKFQKVVPGTLSVSFLAESGPLGGVFYTRAYGGTAGTTFDSGPAAPVQVDGPTPTPTVTATPSRTPTATTTPTATPTRVPDGGNLIQNGSFERDEAWRFGENGPATGAYTSSVVHSGQRAVRLGITPPSNDAASYSSVSQAVTIPADARSADLTLWLWPHTEDDPAPPGSTDGAGAQMAARPAGSPPSQDSGDRQQVILLDDKRQFLALLWSAAENGDGWQRLDFDLSSYRGRTIWIYVNSINDGDGRRTWLFLDDVSLTVAMPPIPSATPTATEAPATHLYLPLLAANEAARPLRAAPPTSAAGTPPPPGLPQVALPAEAEAGAVHAQLTTGGVAVTRGSSTRQLRAPGPLWSVALSPDGQHMAASAPDGRVLIWTTDGQLLAEQRELPRPGGLVWLGDILIVADPAQKRLAFLAPPTYAILRSIPVGEAPLALALAPSRDDVKSRLFVADAGTGTILALDVPTAAVFWKYSVGGLGTLLGLAYDPGSDRLFAAYPLTARFRALVALDATTGTLAARRNGDDRRPLTLLSALRFDPAAGHLIATDGSTTWWFTPDLQYLR
ncbi:MAG: hypothetical protein M5U01_36550 [Ardenticatenaceae bacterium]|nr:hypothetical protein [Ardenticatenaceae bacterium]